MNKHGVLIIRLTAATSVRNKTCFNLICVFETKLADLYVRKTKTFAIKVLCILNMATAVMKSCIYVALNIRV